jgi:hypothetical protein
MPQVVLIALIALLQTGADIVKLAMDGQPVDVRTRMWEEYMADVDKARTFFGLSVPKVP